MAKVYTNFKINWDWSGDEYALKGFNIALCPKGVDPNSTGELIRLDKVTKEKPYEHILRNVLVDNGNTYVAWVQALYEGVDSSWFSNGEKTIGDGGGATVATTDTDNNPISAGNGMITMDDEGLKATYGGDFQKVLTNEKDMKSLASTFDNQGIENVDATSSTGGYDGDYHLDLSLYASSDHPSLSGRVNVDITNADLSKADTLIFYSKVPSYDDTSLGYFYVSIDGDEVWTKKSGTDASYNQEVIDVSNYNSYHNIEFGINVLDSYASSVQILEWFVDHIEYKTRDMLFELSNILNNLRINGGKYIFDDGGFELYNEVGQNIGEIIDSTNGGGQINLYYDSGNLAIQLKNKNASYASEGDATLALQSNNDDSIRTDIEAGGVWINNPEGNYQILNGRVDLEAGEFSLWHLPTSDPQHADQLWNDGGTVKVSSG